MNYKAFQLKVSLQLLIFRDFDTETSTPIIKIYVYWIDNEGDDRLSEETISFENEESAKSFIVDFSEASAIKWCNKNISEDEI